MAQIAYVREFNGSSDYITLANTDYDDGGGGIPIPATTFAAICRSDTDSGYHWAISAAGGTGGKWSFGLNAARPALFFNPTTVFTPTIDTFTVADGWGLIAVTRADGNSTPRFHRYRYSDSNWYHEDNPGALTETAALDSSTLRIGSYDGASEYWDGKIACIGIWYGTALSDGQLEGMVSNVAAWEALTPTGLWLLDQASTATPVPDRVGNGDETAISGTTVAAEATLAFDVGGAVGRTYKRLYGPAQLTGTAADLYTCPASTITRTLHIHASNPSGSPVDVNLSIGADGSATRVWDDLAIKADGVEDVFDPYELAAGEKIQGWADTAGTVVVTITGYEDPV